MSNAIYLILLCPLILPELSVQVLRLPCVQSPDYKRNHSKNKQNSQKHDKQHRNIIFIDPPEPITAAKHHDIDIQVMQYLFHQRPPAADFFVRMKEIPHTAQKCKRQKLPEDIPVQRYVPGPEYFIINRADQDAAGCNHAEGQQ